MMMHALGRGGRQMNEKRGFAERAGQQGQVEGTLTGRADVMDRVPTSLKKA